MEPINFGHPMYGTPTKHKTRRKNEHLRACKAWKARHGALMAWFQYVSVPLGQPVYHSLPQWLVELILKKTVHAIRSSFFVDETILDVDPLCSVSNFGPTMIAICWIIMPKRCDEIYLTPLYSYNSSDDDDDDDDDEFVWKYTLLHTSEQEQGPAVTSGLVGHHGHGTGFKMANSLVFDPFRPPNQSFQSFQSLVSVHFDATPHSPKDVISTSTSTFFLPPSRRRGGVSWWNWWGLAPSKSCGEIWDSDGVCVQGFATETTEKRRPHADSSFFPAHITHLLFKKLSQITSP